MLQSTAAKFIPNQFVEVEQQQYIRSANVKSKVTQKKQSQPFKDHTNKLSSLNKSEKPTKLVLQGYEKQNNENNLVKDQQFLKEFKASDRRKNIVCVELDLGSDDEFDTKTNQEDRQYEEKHPLDQSLSVQANPAVQNRQKENAIIHQNKTIQESSDDQKTQGENKQISQNETQKIESIRQTLINRNVRKNVFNLELDDESSEEQLAKTDRKQESEDIKQNEQVFRPSKCVKIELGDSSDEQREREFEEKKRERLQKRNEEARNSKVEGKKTIFEDIDLNSDSQNDDTKTVFNQINEEQLQDHLSLVKQISVDKFKQLKNLPYGSLLTKCSVPLDYQVSLVIKRDLDKGEYIVFDSETVTQIMRVRKKIGGTYIFYQDNKKEGKMCEVAKMKTNFIGTEFDCYMYELQNQQKIKKKCLSVGYDLNIFGLKGPRKISVIIPHPNVAVETEKSLQEIYESSKNPHNCGLYKYESKIPKWMPDINAYVLNMHGTALYSSIKNCIIVEPNHKNREHLIFGKKSKDAFNLNIKHPFTILQGVAFAVSSFEKKLGCE